MPTPTNTQLIGGVFQDSNGNVLNLGYLILKLNQDNSVAGVGNICAGIEIKILLDSSGSVSTSPQQFIWATDVLATANAFYTVTGYTAAGQIAWGPNNQQVTSGGTGGGTFDIGLWVPGVVFSWTPPVQPLTLKHNNILNGSQTVLNLTAGANVAISDDGLGGITIAVTGITGITLKTNGVANGSQVLLNQVAGNGITLTDNGTGSVTIAGASIQINGTPTASQKILNFVTGTGVTMSDGGGGVINISASTSVASGIPIFQQPTGGRGWTPIAAAFIGSNITFVQGFSGTAVRYPNLGSWKIQLFNQSGTWTLDSANVAQVVTGGSGVVNATTSISFGSVSSNISIPAGLNTSDAISMTLDPNYDYYIRFRISGSGGNVNFYQSATGSSFPGGFMSVSGSHEADNPINLGTPTTTFADQGSSLLYIISA